MQAQRFLVDWSCCVTEFLPVAIVDTDLVGSVSSTRLRLHSFPDIPVGSSSLGEQGCLRDAMTGSRFLIVPVQSSSRVIACCTFLSVYCCYMCVLNGRVGLCVLNERVRVRRKPRGTHSFTGATENLPYVPRGNRVKWFEL